MWKKSSFGWCVSACLALGAMGCGESAGVDGQNGASGVDGLTSLVESEAVEPGELCEWGGVRLLSGLDMDADGALSADEVQSESLVCFAPGETGAEGPPGEDGQGGQNGQNSLIEVSDEAPGELCVQGGVRVDVGLDANGNGVLDAEEISATRFICDGEDGVDGQDGANGQDGADGQDGSNSLMELSDEAPGAICPQGGVRVDVGVDANNDGVLDAEEISATRTICEGEDGANGQDGADGQDGQDGEDGADGLNSLIEVSRDPGGEACPYGGRLFQVGRDLNANGVLEPAEVEQEERDCDAKVVTDLAFPSPDTLANSSQGNSLSLGANPTQSFFETSHTIQQTFSADKVQVVRSLIYDLEVFDNTGGFCTVGTLSFEVLLNGVRIDTFSFAGESGGQTLQIAGEAEFAPLSLEGEYTLRIRPLNDVCPGGRFYRWLPGGTFVLNG